jgi:hypothetical protein
MNVYGLTHDGETIYHTKQEIIVREAFAISGDHSCNFDKAFKDIQLFRKNPSVYYREELREQGLLHDYYGVNLPFHIACSSVRNIRPGQTRKLRRFPDIEFCCIEMSECEICRMNEYC